MMLISTTLAMEVLALWCGHMRQRVSMSVGCRLDISARERLHIAHRLQRRVRDSRKALVAQLERELHDLKQPSALQHRVEARRVAS